MNFGKGYANIFVFFLCYSILQVSTSATEFSNPGSFSSYQSNLGGQKVVEVANKWVGATPQEIAPGSIPLGSLEDRKYVLSDESKSFSNQKPVDSFTPIPQNRYQEFEPRKMVEYQTPQKKQVGTRWVGPKPDALAPGIVPLGSLGDKFYGQTPARSTLGNSKEESHVRDSGLRITTFGSTRPVYNSNVLQVEEDVVGTVIWENSMGVSLSQPLAVGSYLTLIPKLDALMQTAAYQEKEQVDPKSLNYIYAMAKLGLGFEFSNDFSITSGIEFGSSRSLRSFNKQFESVVPSLQMSNLFMLNESSILMLDTMLRYSLTDGQKPIQKDDGDNVQVGVNLGLVKIFGGDGQFMLVNSLGLSRSNYLKHGNDGRVDWLAYTSLNLSWQILDWLSADFGTRYSNRWVNSTGNSLGIPEYNSLDVALTLMANHLF